MFFSSLSEIGYEKVAIYLLLTMVSGMVAIEMAWLVYLVTRVYTLKRFKPCPCAEQQDMARHKAEMLSQALPIFSGSNVKDVIGDSKVD
jgi:hypothetical protein